MPATRWRCGNSTGSRAPSGRLVETAENLAKREIGRRVLTWAIDTTSPGGRHVFHVFAAVAEFRA